MIEILKGVSIFLGVLLTITYLYQFVYLFVPFFKKRKAHGAEKRNRYAVLIAARNEEPVLPFLLDSIRAQDYPAELVDTYVIADNCTDATAAVAAAHGAHVYQRFNKTQIGKGYALSYLLGRMREDQVLDRYDAFLVFDADNLLEKNYITEMNKTCSDGYEAFCGYRNSKNYGGSWVSAGYALWYLHDSVHLNQSRMLLGTTCAVTGTGFGFTRGLLEKCGGWHFFTLTEDIEFDTWCATSGVRIAYCPDAVLYDEQPEDLAVSWKQRTRWVQGGIQISFKYIGDLLRGLFKGGRVGYASFETLTLSLWGYGTSALVAAFAMLTTALSAQWPGVLLSFLWGILSLYASMFFIGALTTATEWNRIHATKAQKIGYLFTFPLFMMTYIPVSVCAMFKKFQWQSVEHKVAVSVKELDAAR
jgi:cellulose synthase/poly-beta-1,6-N-acetylglucosamine synthase-like glycosyltransferase